MEHVHNENGRPTGQPKVKGGDSWFVILRDMRSNVKISCRVFDEGDGTVRGAGARTGAVE